MSEHKEDLNKINVVLPSYDDLCQATAALARLRRSLHELTRTNAILQNDVMRFRKEADEARQKLEGHQIQPVAEKLNEMKRVVELTARVEELERLHQCEIERANRLARDVCRSNSENTLLKADNERMRNDGNAFAASEKKFCDTIHDLRKRLSAKTEVAHGLNYEVKLLQNDVTKLQKENGELKGQLEQRLETVKQIASKLADEQTKWRNFSGNLVFPTVPEATKNCEVQCRPVDKPDFVWTRSCGMPSEGLLTYKDATKLMVRMESEPGADGLHYRIATVSTTSAEQLVKENPNCYEIQYQCAKDEWRRSANMPGGRCGSQLVTLGDAEGFFKLETSGTRYRVVKKNECKPDEVVIEPVKVIPVPETLGYEIQYLRHPELGFRRCNINPPGGIGYFATLAEAETARERRKIICGASEGEETRIVCVTKNANGTLSYLKVS